MPRELDACPKRRFEMVADILLGFAASGKPITTIDTTNMTRSFDGQMRDYKAMIIELGLDELICASKLRPLNNRIVLARLK